MLRLLTGCYAKIVLQTRRTGLLRGTCVVVRISSLAGSAMGCDGSKLRVRNLPRGSCGMTIWIRGTPFLVWLLQLPPQH